MQQIIQSLKTIPIFPYILSVPLLLATIGFAIPINGTDDIMFTPAMLCYVGFVVCALLPLFYSQVTIPKTPTVFFVFAFLVWLVLSLNWSQVPYVSAFFTMTLSTLPVIFLVMVMRPDRELWVPIHLLAIGIAIIGAGVWAMIQFFFMFDTYGPRIKHPMLNPNNLAAFFNLALLPSLGMFLLARHKQTMALALGLVTLFLLGLLVTFGKGAFSAFVISTVVLVAATFDAREIQWKRYLAIAAVMLACYLIVNAVSAGYLDTSMSNLSSIMGKHTAHNRLEMWKASFELGKEYFWGGIGLGTFYFFYPPFRPQMDSSDGFFAHMDPLQFWIEMGIMAPIIFYGTLVAILLRTIKALKVLPMGSDERVHIMAPFCGLLAVVGHTHITFNLYMPAIVIVMACLLAYWYIATERVLLDADKRFAFNFKDKAHRHTGALAFILVALICASWPMRVGWAIHYSKEAQRAASKKDQALSKVEMMGLFAPDSFSRYYEYRARIDLSHLINRDLSNMPVSQVRHHFDEAMRFLDEAEKRNPKFWNTPYLRARAYYAVDDVLIVDGKEMAIKLLKNNVDYNPLDLDSRMELAKIYQKEGNLKESFTVLKEGLSWPRPRGKKDLEFLVSLANMYKKLGSEKAYNQLMKEVKRRADQYGIKVRIKQPSS